MNEDLFDATKHPSTVGELLRTHAALCHFYDVEEISWSRWLHHFYRGEKKYGATQENRQGKRLQSSSSLQEKRLPLLASEAEGLAAFLAFVLCRFVLPHGAAVIRPETFLMASYMAEGRRIALAPTVLGHIYHGLGEMATYPGNPGRANPSFGLHFVIGWLAEYFVCLYPSRPPKECNPDYPFLVRYAGVRGHKLSLRDARCVFRNIDHVSYKSINFSEEDQGRDLVDHGDLSANNFEKLVTLRSSLLPVRVGSSLILETYYPNRFARQLGFDQSIPSNNLAFIFSQRGKKSLNDIALAYARLFRAGTGASFHVPGQYYVGTCAWNYCGWWVRMSLPYLSQPVHKEKTILTGDKSIEREPVYVIRDLRTIVPKAHIAVELSVGSFSPLGIHATPVSSAFKMGDNSTGPELSVGSKRKTFDHCKVSSQNILPFQAGTHLERMDEISRNDSLSEDVHFKRKRYPRPEKSSSINLTVA